MKADPELRRVSWWRGSLRPRPVHGWEIAAMRFLLIALVNWKMPDALPFTDQPRPVGLGQWIDFSFLGQPGVYGWVRVTLLVLSVPYVFGRWLPAVVPLIAALHVSVFTFYNSQGFINHTWQLISMILVAQSAVVLVLAGWRATTRKPFPFRPGVDSNSFWLYFSQGTLVVGYVTSGVSKLINSEGQWLWKTRNIPIALLRTQMQQYYSNPVSPTPPPVPPFAQWLIDHPAWAMWIFGPGLILELFAFAALWNRTLAFWTGIALIVMHRLIAVIMDLHFELNEWAALIFFVNLPWWAWWVWTRWHGTPTELRFAK